MMMVYKHWHFTQYYFCAPVANLNMGEYPKFDYKTSYLDGLVRCVILNYSVVATLF